MSLAETSVCTKSNVGAKRQLRMCSSSALEGRIKLDLLKVGGFFSLISVHFVQPGLFVSDQIRFLSRRNTDSIRERPFNNNGMIDVDWSSYRNTNEEPKCLSSFH
jgi:hypothetical protein